MKEYVTIAFNGGQSIEEPKRYAYFGVISPNDESSLPQKNNGAISLGYIYAAAGEGRIEIRYKGPNLDDAKNSVKSLEDITDNPNLLHCLLSRPIPLTPKNEEGTQLFGWEVPFRRN